LRRPEVSGPAQKDAVPIRAKKSAPVITIYFKKIQSQKKAAFTDNLFHIKREYNLLQTVS
jgi:hypothetical protein